MRVDTGRWARRAAVPLAVVVGAAGLALTGAVAAPAAAAANSDRVVLSVGHTDALAVFFEDGELKARVNDDTSPPPVIREADEVLFHAKPEAMTPLPPPGTMPPAYEFLREVGDPLWILPQTQDEDLLWPGWSSETIPFPSETFVDSELTWTLHDIRGPGDDPPPGGFVLWIDGLATPHSIPFNTTDALPQSTTMRTGTHAHFNWGFAAEGLYRFTFEVEGELVGGGTVSTGLVEYRFFVGDLADLPDPPGQPALSFRLGNAALLGAAQRRLRLRGVRVNRAARLRATVHRGKRQAAANGKRQVARTSKARQAGPNRRQVSMQINRRLPNGRYWVRVQASAAGRTVNRYARVRVRH